MSTDHAPSFTLSGESGRTVLAVAGDWVVSEIGKIDAALRDLGVRHALSVLDVNALRKIDTAGAYVLSRTFQAGGSGGAMVIEGAHETAAELIERVRFTGNTPPEAEAPHFGVIATLERIGRGAQHVLDEAWSTISFFGETIATTARMIANPLKMRWTALFSVMERAGFDAIPIIAFLSFFIGIVLAYMGAFILSSYGGGAEVWTVEMVGFIVMREFGVLVTAIILAGRTNSAFTAQIGAMRMRQEVDAMRTLGLSPMEVLVVPRVVALVLMTPILTFIAVLSALFGALMICWISLDVNPSVFVQRTQDYVPVQNFWVGLSKAPIFGFMVAMIGCRQGLSVEGSVQSLGSRTTTSVVQALFAIIVINAFFAIFYMELGI